MAEFLWASGVGLAMLAVGEIDGFWRGRMVTTIESLRHGYLVGRKQEREVQADRERRVEEAFRPTTPDVSMVPVPEDVDGYSVGGRR